MHNIKIIKLSSTLLIVKLSWALCLPNKTGLYKHGLRFTKMNYSPTGNYVKMEKNHFKLIH
jgi:hypothetical protein